MNLSTGKPSDHVSYPNRLAELANDICFHDSWNRSIPVEPTIARDTSLTVICNGARREERFFIIEFNPLLDAA